MQRWQGRDRQPPRATGALQLLLLLFLGDALSKKLSWENVCHVPSWVPDPKTRSLEEPPVLPWQEVTCGIPVPLGSGSGQQQPSELAPSLCPACGLGLLSGCPFSSSPRQVVTFLPG